MTRNEIIELYLTSLNSEGSRNEYRKVVSKFVEAVDKELCDITPLDCNAYVATAYTCAATTRNTRVCVLKSFAKWLVANGVIKKDFAAGIKSLRAESEPKDRLTSEEVQRMYKLGNARERAIISLLLNTGLRVAEVTSLKVADYNCEELRVKTKGSRYRTIYLSESTRADIDNYINTRKVDSDLLFASYGGKQITDHSLNASWAKLARKANINKHITNHSFRRLVVTEVANEYGLAMAQKFIGHKNVATTAKYFQTDEEEIKNIYINRG